MFGASWNAPIVIVGKQKMSKDQHRTELIKALQAAGDSYFAFRLEKLFYWIETPADIALHNDILKEVMILIEPDPAGFMKEIADYLLYKKPEPRKPRFLKVVANRIMQIANKGT